MNILKNIDIKKVISNYKVFLVLFIFIGVVSSIQHLTSGTSVHDKLGLSYNHYNNYSIFKYSFQHLIEYKDLYIMHINDHFDLYKYTPTFSVFFGIFAVFPDWIGLNLWNIFNALILLVAIYYLPKFNSYQKGLILIIILLELITSIQNTQSNALIAALFVYAFGFLERRKYLLATLFITFSVFIKLFGIVGFALFILYPKKWKLALYSIFWLIMLSLVPLLFINVEQYKLLIYSYVDMLKNDHTDSYGYSVMGWLYTWFSLEFNKYIVVVIGAILFLLPMINISNYKYYSFRILALASILIWVVIFNHKAESPTFILAMTGGAIWFIISNKNLLNNILFWIALVLTSLSPTDLFPSIIREEIVIPFVLKGVPCILIWCKIIFDMLVMKSEYLSIESTDN